MYGDTGKSKGEVPSHQSKPLTKVLIRFLGTQAQMTLEVSTRSTEMGNYRHRSITGRVLGAVQGEPDGTHACLI